MVRTRPAPLRRARTLALALALMALAGCAALDPSGRLFPQQEATPPAGAPQVTGAPSPHSAQTQRLIALFGGAYTAPRAEALLNSVLARLAAASDNPGQAYKVTVLNSPAANAFALPSGDLFVTRGLLALANDSSEIAAVMAHEIAHVTLRHAHQREEAARTAALRTQVASRFQGPVRGEEVKASSQLTIASFSRQQELEADRVGVDTIARAGFDPYGASRFLRSLGRSVEMRAALLGRGAAADSDLLSSHPSTPERVEQAILAARRFGAPGIGAQERAAYLDAIDGIAFGDDPAEGVVRGRTFIHGNLGVSFTAPPGFTLENSPQALVGVDGSGTRALRLDRVKIEKDQKLEEYLATGWIEGLRKNSIRGLTISAMPAATADALHNGWFFNVAAVRRGEDVYRLIFAARNRNARIEREFARSIESFRQLTPAETQALRPLRLALATARSGDSVAAMARRMAVSERPADVFRLINAIAESGALESGRRYKIVVE